MTWLRLADLADHVRNPVVQASTPGEGGLMTEVLHIPTGPAEEEWRTYDEFAAGIDTYRLPNVDLSGTSLELVLADEFSLTLNFGPDIVSWSSKGSLEASTREDPYDAVAVRAEVIFVNLPLTSAEGAALTIVYSTTTRRCVVVQSLISAERVEGTPQVCQRFWPGTVSGGPPSGEVPGPSRDLIGKRNVYRYSPQHLYEHIYISSQRYAWQCLEGVQRGHGDMDLSTVWKFADGLYLFCFREFRIAVASVWLHDLGYQLQTTGIFLGLNGAGSRSTRELAATSIPSARSAIQTRSRYSPRPAE